MLAGLGLALGVATLTSGEPAGLIFFEGGGPEADCRSLLNSNFLFAGGCQKNSHHQVYTFFEIKNVQPFI